MKTVVYTPASDTSGQTNYIPQYLDYRVVAYNNSAVPVGTTTIYTVPTGYYARILNVYISYVEGHTGSLNVDGTAIFNAPSVSTESFNLYNANPIMVKNTISITVTGAAARRWTLSINLLLTDKRTEPLVW